MNTIYIVFEKRNGKVWAFGSKKAIFSHVSDRYGIGLHTLYRMPFNADGHWENENLSIYKRRIIRIRQNVTQK